MDAWELWIAMARESSETAQLAEAAGHLRSATSRYYYAAYQAVTALLLYQGLIPPNGVEAWSHFLTPTLLSEGAQTLIKSRGRRTDLAMRMRGLYELRLTADYRAEGGITQSRIAAARRDAGFILKVVNDIFPEDLL